MRFKATLRNDKIHAFKDLINALDKTCIDSKQNIVMHINPSSMRFIMKNSLDEVQIFVQLVPNSMFTTYRIESRAENNISCEIHVKSFLHVLRSVNKAQCVRFKLTKKLNVPCITTEAQMQDHNVVQDVRVKLLTTTDMEGYTEPQVSVPDISIDVDCGNLKPIVDRMKSFDKYIELRANSLGNLTIGVTSDLVALKSYFKGLNVRNSNDANSGGDIRNAKEVIDAAAKVDVKRFSRILNVDTVHPLNILCCITQGEALILHVVLDRNMGSMTYYMPIYYVSDDASDDSGDSDE